MEKFADYAASLMTEVEVIKEFVSTIQEVTKDYTEKSEDMLTQYTTELLTIMKKKGCNCEHKSKH